MILAFSRLRTRRAQGEAERPTLPASSCTGMRPSICSARTILRSMSSNLAMADFAAFPGIIGVYRHLEPVHKPKLARLVLRALLGSDVSGADDARCPDAHSRRSRTQNPVARHLDDPQCQSPAIERRRSQGRRPSGLLGFARH